MKFRISEKSMELNFCSLIWPLDAPYFWFGLTQKQEAQAGFDFCSRIRGRLILFQMKCSNDVNQKRGRRFLFPHDQLSELVRRCGRYRRSVYYVLPDFGQFDEIRYTLDWMDKFYLLDVSEITSLGPPTRNGKKELRKSGSHLVDVKDMVATIHSDPITVPVRSAWEVFGSEFHGSDGAQFLLDQVDGRPERLLNVFGKQAYGLVLPPHIRAKVRK